MLNFIDISSWQGDIDLSPLPIDAVVVKATEGTDYLNPYFEKKLQESSTLGLKIGFYHYAKDNDPIAEATFFLDNIEDWLYRGIPVLDWEEGQSVEWVNAFVNHVHDRTGVWCWIYGNPWRFDQGGVEQNCARWVASYPNVLHPGFYRFDMDDAPDCDGLMCAWQFCSDGRINGYDGDLDLNHFYGDEYAWDKYANPGNGSSPSGTNGKQQRVVLEDDDYIITIERKR